MQKTYPTLRSIHIPNSSPVRSLTKASSWLFVVGLLLSPVTVRAMSGPQLLMAGEKALDKKQYSKALELLKKAAKKLPHWGLVHLALARAMQFTGSPVQDTSKTYQKALKMLPNNPRAQLAAALFWEAMGKQSEALALYSKAIKLGHPSPVACLRASQLWLQKKQGKKGIYCLRELLRRNNKTISNQVYHLLAQALAYEKKITEAGRFYHLATQARSDWLSVLKEAHAFFTTHLKTQDRSTKRKWRRYIRKLKKRIWVLNPKRPKRKMRPLLPSRNKQK